MTRESILEENYEDSDELKCDNDSVSLCEDNYVDTSSDNENEW